MSNLSNQDPARPLVGQAISRTSGAAKVTGQARYTGEMSVERLVYGVLVSSTIARGELTDLDTKAAEAVPGVVGVMTHRNMPPVIPQPPVSQGGGGGTVVVPMRDTRIHYAGQPIAMVLADTLENATHAASLVRAKYKTEEANTELEKGRARAKPFRIPKMRGNADQALAGAPVKIDATYHIPIEHHNPIEPSGTVAIWEGNKLTVYEPSQWLKGVQLTLSRAFGIPFENVRVLAKHIGGAFGCKAYSWPHTLLTTAAAQLCRRPVKLINTREDEYVAHGFRPEAEQRYQLGADAQGKLLALRADIHTITAETDVFFTEAIMEIPTMLFSCANVHIQGHSVPVDCSMPTAMRAPGEAEATFALSSIIDELAARVNRDPLAVHLLNYAERDEAENLPWSSKELRQCYLLGAERFGWSKRNHTPGSMKDGHLSVGWGIGVGAYPIYLSPAQATIRFYADGRVLVQSTVHEIGIGVDTIMAQVTADTLGVPLDRVSVAVGDTEMPAGPRTTGSRTTTSLLPAVQATGRTLVGQFIALALTDTTGPLTGLQKNQIELRNGRLVNTADPTKSDSFVELLKRCKLPFLEAYDEYLPPGTGAVERSQLNAGSETRTGPKVSEHMAYSYGAVFVEVKINPFIGQLHVTRVVGAYDGGRIINPKTADSQIRGGIIMGIGMACTEETVTDHRLHRFVNNNLADYHVPVQADVPRMDIQFVDSEDKIVGPLGSKAVGELGINGVAGAICNAVYHATGKRIRSLPITPEKLLM